MPRQEECLQGSFDFIDLMSSDDREIKRHVTDVVPSKMVFGHRDTRTLQRQLGHQSKGDSVVAVIQSMPYGILSSHQTTHWTTRLQFNEMGSTGKTFSMFSVVRQFSVRDMNMIGKKKDQTLRAPKRPSESGSSISAETHLTRITCWWLARLCANPDPTAREA